MLILKVIPLVALHQVMGFQEDRPLATLRFRLKNNLNHPLPISFNNFYNNTFKHKFLQSFLHPRHLLSIPP
jgi:hypothetical protein